MKPSPFLLASGLVANVEISPEAREGLRDFAYDFLSAGGDVSLDEWSRLTEDDKDALSMAVRRIESERAAETARRVIDEVGKLLADGESDAANKAAELLAKDARRDE